MSRDRLEDSRKFLYKPEVRHAIAAEVQSRRRPALGSADNLQPGDRRVVRAELEN